MESNDLLIQLKDEILELRKAIKPGHFSQTVSDKWLPRSTVMKFLNYGDTQMSSLEKSGQIVVTKVGKRKFIHKDSLNNLLDKHTIIS